METSEPPGTPALIEPVHIDDEYCSGLARVEAVGSLARFVLFTEQPLYEANGTVVWVVRRKILMPISAIVPSMELAAAHLARRKTLKIVRR